MPWLRVSPRRSNRCARIAVGAAALLMLGSALAAPSAFAQQGGSLPGFSGGELSSADLAQGTHIIVVWASWSPRCRDIAPRVNELVQALSSLGRVVTVNFQEERAAIADFVRQNRLDAPIFLDRDGEFSKGHAVTTLPGLIVVRKGEVVFQGRLAADAEAQIRELLR